MKLKVNLRKLLIILIPSSLLIVLFQNCGQVHIQPESGYTSFASNLSLTLRPPTEYTWNRRYVFLVDMSYSMVSGPCPFDVDVSNSTHGFENTYVDYDPNFSEDLVNFADARARVADCSVDTNLEAHSMQLDTSRPFDSTYIPDHKTYKGNDFEGNRIKIIKTWIKQMREANNTEFLERTDILIIPVAGGIAFDRLLANYPLRDFTFKKLLDPKIDETLTYLENIHTQTANQALMPAADRFTQYDPNLEALKMGTSSLTFAYDKAFSVIDSEMEKLAKQGHLTHSTFKVMSFGDQRTNPLDEHYNKALAYFSGCLDCESSLTKAWGVKQDSQHEVVDLKLSLIQGLSKYYGSGFFDIDFINMSSFPLDADSNNLSSISYLAQNGNDTNIGSEFPSTQINIIDFLDQRSAQRKASSRIYKINQNQPPYRIANNNSGVTTFKATHIFVLNSNFKIDMNGKPYTDIDGDGLADDKEAALGMSSSQTRTNGLCLDSVMAEPGYSSRCLSLFQSKLCNPDVDSDGDGLNECEELTIGTDSFDFDTDGDGVPDSLEILYAMNPISDDSKTDSNADGISNMMNLGKGLNPQALPTQVRDKDKISIILDYLEQQKIYSSQLGNVKIDSFKLDLLNFPLMSSQINAQPLKSSFLLRPGSKGFISSSQIPVKHQLIKPSLNKLNNNLIGLIRIVDPEEPLRVYWEIFDLTIDTRSNNTMSTIDLSKFSQIRAIDRVRLSK